MTFSARFAGTCASPNCNYDNRIRTNDACEYVDDEIMHAACAAAARRDEAIPYCGKCFCFHRGEC